jgi:eukaryotic-like serine/threonine-protein kinase
MPTMSSARFQAALGDRYLIDRVVGRGGMGTVYLARDVKHGRQVAVKAVSPERLNSLGSASFLREVRLTARLQHPHILPLLDSGEVLGWCYYVTPFVRGGSLRELMDRKQKFSVEETLEIIRGVVGALQYAHESRVVHCDIKPENILISEGHAVLADFGLSKALYGDGHSWRAETSNSGGTPAYVSPEQASGDQLDNRSDVYSLACVVFEMLAGVPPFEGPTDMAVISKRFRPRTPDIRAVAPHVPVGIAGAIRRALALESCRRYSSVDHFARALARGANRGARPAAEAVALLTARVKAMGARWYRVVLRRPKVAAQRLITQSRQSLESVKMGAKTSSGGNWRSTTS